MTMPGRRLSRPACNASTWRIALFLLLGMCPAMAWPQGDGNVSPEQRKRLIEQKLRLVESLINSPAAQTSTEGREPEASALVGNGRMLLDQVRTAMAADRFDEASVALDEALRSATRASARLSSKPGALSSSVQQANHKNLTEQLASYRSGIEDLARQGNGEAKALATRINLLQADARTLADAGKLGDANRKLADAYKLAVESISRLRAGQTVTLSLKFNTPVEEYDYERRRFQSSEILVNMMLAEGRADDSRRNVLPGFDNISGEELPEGGRRSLVDQLVKEARQQLGLAAAEAHGGDYKTAVTSMEKAVAKLNRALQMMGVPIF
jgi:hypothetical protein